MVGGTDRRSQEGRRCRPQMPPPPATASTREQRPQRTSSHPPAHAEARSSGRNCPMGPRMYPQGRPPAGRGGGGGFSNGRAAAGHGDGGGGGHLRPLPRAVARGALPRHPWPPAPRSRGGVVHWGCGSPHGECKVLCAASAEQRRDTPQQSMSNSVRMAWPRWAHLERRVGRSRHVGGAGLRGRGGVLREGPRDQGRCTGHQGIAQSAAACRCTSIWLRIGHASPFFARWQRAGESRLRETQSLSLPATLSGVSDSDVHRLSVCSSLQEPTGPPPPGAAGVTATAAVAHDRSLLPPPHTLSHPAACQTVFGW